MPREVVTGYCWPQSVAAGESVDLHVSSAGGRPVRVTVNGATIDVAAQEHATPAAAAGNGCGWPVAHTITTGADWASGFYEVVLEIDVGDKVRRDYAFFVVRPHAGTKIVLALASNTWAAYNDFGGPNLYTGGTTV